MQRKVTEQDAKIAGIAHERGKGVIIAVNKWDAIEKNDKTIYKFTNKVREILSYMPYAEILFISAKPDREFRNYLKPLIWCLKIRPFVFRPVYSMRL